MTTFTPVESVTRTALLGLRLWDAVAGAAVSDGIQATEVSSGRRAVANTVDVLAFHDLPGLRASSYGNPSTGFWSSPPAARTFTFQVVDTNQRFLPFRFTTTVPQDGLYVAPCADPGATATPLSSSPARPTIPAFAAIRADLWDVVNDVPAAWAVLEVQGVGSAPWRGVADSAGRALLLCPYPEPRWSGSSPPAGSQSLSTQAWPITFSAQYGPTATGPIGSPPPVPDICAVLTQPAATLLNSVSPDSPLLAQTLTFGRELILRTGTQSVLLVLPS